MWIIYYPTVADILRDCQGGADFLFDSDHVERMMIELEQIHVVDNILST